MPLFVESASTEGSASEQEECTYVDEQQVTWVGTCATQAELDAATALYNSSISEMSALQSDYTADSASYCNSLFLAEEHPNWGDCYATENAFTSEGMYREDGGLANDASLAMRCDDRGCIWTAWSGYAVAAYHWVTKANFLFGAIEKRVAVAIVAAQGEMIAAALVVGAMTIAVAECMI